MQMTQGKKGLRLLKIVSELKKGNYPNSTTLIEILRREENDNGKPFAVSARTIMRDIEDLKEKFGAPIEFDSNANGYFLGNKDWSLPVIPTFEEDFTSMAILGTRLAEDIVPEPVRQSIDEAIDKTLATNGCDFFDDAMIDTMLCASGMKSFIDPEVFKMLFGCWRKGKVVSIQYRDPQGKTSEAMLEPHIIAFHKGNWYVKGYLYNTKEVRVFACQRITDVKPFKKNTGGELIDATFQHDRKLLAETRKKGLFIYPKISGVKLHCDASIAFYIYEQQHLFKSKIDRQADGSLILTLNPTVEHDLIRWILGEAGRIQVLEPLCLREKIAEAGREITRQNS
ncbi:MAG: WYL domain-containing protein [Victivallales bacterium]|nr:WYL domain-containing protein [Victivallales bacterium]